VNLHQVTPDRLGRVADVLGRALSTEAMLTWPLGEDVVDLPDVCSRYMQVLDRAIVDLGMLWEAGDALGAALWVPADRHDEFWAAMDSSELQQREFTQDGGERLGRLWSWVASVIPHEPMWLLDQLGVDAAQRGRGVGADLIRMGLDLARADGVDAYLETGTERNVRYYRTFGFDVVEHGTVPGGGIPVWFLRWSHASN
jgi:GNAT superfamily N-acetyltransferase